MTCHDSSSKCFPSYFNPVPCSGVVLAQNSALPSLNLTQEGQTGPPELLLLTQPSVMCALGNAADDALNIYSCFLELLKYVWSP